VVFIKAEKNFRMINGCKDFRRAIERIERIQIEKVDTKREQAA